MVSSTEERSSLACTPVLRMYVCYRVWHMQDKGVTKTSAECQVGRRQYLLGKVIDLMPDLLKGSSGRLFWRQRLSRLRGRDRGSLIWRRRSAAGLPLRSFLRGCIARCSCLVWREAHERLLRLLLCAGLLISLLLSEGFCLHHLDISTCVKELLSHP